MRPSKTPANDLDCEVPEDVREIMKQAIRQLREHDPGAYLAAIARLAADFD